MARLKTDDSWLLEQLAVLISLLSMTTIIALLAYYNGKPLITWHQVKFNAIVSVLATLARTAIIFSTASCLGQFKWIWFKEKPQNLEDFELISQAVQGTQGGSKLLLRTKSR